MKVEELKPGTRLVENDWIGRPRLLCRCDLKSLVVRLPRLKPGSPCRAYCGIIAPPKS